MEVDKKPSMELGISDGQSELRKIEVKITTLGDPEATGLLERHKEEVIEKYPAEAGMPLLADDVRVFMILKRKGLPVACGGLRPLEQDPYPIAELKRMYVLPECRGKAQGISGLLMHQLELQAVQSGFRCLRLETGWDMFQARKYYESHGYQGIPLYGHYVGDVNSSQSVCYEKLI